MAAADVAKRPADLIEIQRFCDERTGGERTRFLGGLAPAGHHDHWNPCERSVAQLRRAELLAIHRGEHEIQQHHAGLCVGAQVVQRVAAVLGARDVISISRERDTQQFTNRGIVVYHEDGTTMRRPGREAHTILMRKRGAIRNRWVR